MTTPREDAIAALHDYCPACPNGDRTQCREPLHDEIDRLAALAAEADRDAEELDRQGAHPDSPAMRAALPLAAEKVDDIDRSDRGAGHYLDLDSPEAAERLARALPAVARSLWAWSEVGDHQQVWFDEDVLRHFEEYADDTAAAILAALREPER